MRIEEIKQRLTNLDEGKVVKYDNLMNLSTQYMLDYKNDVGYLLHILDLLEQDLTYMKQHGELAGIDGRTKISIDRALQTVRGN